MRILQSIIFILISALIWTPLGAAAINAHETSSECWICAPQGTNLYDLLRDFGSFISGLLALMAGYFAYSVGKTQAQATINSTMNQIREQERVRNEELETVRKSLALELRSVLSLVYASYKGLTDSLKKGSVSFNDISFSTILPMPSIYQSVAPQISQLTNISIDLFVFYQLVDISRQKLALLANARNPEQLDVQIVQSIRRGLLMASASGAKLLPHLKTGLPSTDPKDIALSEDIELERQNFNRQIGNLAV